MKSPKPPPAPDPREIAQTEAEFNRIDQFTPFGSLTFSGPNRNVSTLSLTPELQQNVESRLASDTNLLQEALRRQGQLDASPISLDQFGPIQSGIDREGINFTGGTFDSLPNLNLPSLTNQIDVSGLPQIPSDVGQFRGDVEQAVFDRARGLLDPVFSDRERELRQSLSNRGLPESGEAFGRELDRFNLSRERAFTDAANQAVISGGQEASRALGDVLAAQGQGFGQSLAGANFANQSGLLGLGAQQGIRGQLFGEGVTGAGLANQAAGQEAALRQQQLQNANAARIQGLSEAQGIRQNQFNELASLLGLQQVQAPGLQNFFAPGQSNVTGAFGLQQNALQNAFNADTARSAAGLGGLFGLGSALIGAPSGGLLGGILGF